MLKFGTSILALLLVSGCGDVPFPHKEWVSPPASGRVIDATTYQPIAKGSVTRFKPSVAAATTRTDLNGRFDLFGCKQTRWLHLDRGALVSYRVEAFGYKVIETNLGGWAYARDLRHDLGDVLLSPQPGK